MIFDGVPADFNKDALDAIYGGIEAPDDAITDTPMEERSHDSA